MKLSRRELLRLATAVGCHSAVVAAVPTLGCGRQAPLRDPISREKTVASLRELLREKVTRLEARYGKATALTTSTTKTVAVRDRLGHRLDRTEMDALVIRVFDGKRWHGFGLSTLQPSAITKLVSRIESSVPVQTERETTVKRSQHRSTRDAIPEDFERRGRIDLATTKEEQWRERVSSIHSVLATTGSSRTIYRGCIAESRDEVRLVIGNGVDVRQSVGRVRVSAVMISRPGDFAIAEEIVRGGSGGLEWISIDRAEIESASTNALILPVGTVPRAMAKTTAVILSPDVIAAIISNGLRPQLLAESPVASFAPVNPVNPASRSVASSLVNLSDDPGLVGGYASYDVDDDGVRVRPKVLIENGLFTSPITTARGGFATGHGRVDRDGLLSSRLSNLTLSGGSTTHSDLVNKLSEGLVIESIETIGVDPRSGSFVLRARRAREVRGGSLSARVYGPVSIRASLDQLLADVTAVSSETNLVLKGESGEIKSEPALAIRCPFVLTRATVS